MNCLDIRTTSGKKMTINLHYLISFADAGHYTEVVLMRGNYKIDMTYEKFKEMCRTNRYDVTTKISK